MNIDTGGNAFPYSALTPDGPTIYKDCKGMTLRDYFAGQALIGYSTKENRKSLMATAKKMDVPMSPEDIDDQFAKASYLMADAMIKEREK